MVVARGSLAGTMVVLVLLGRVEETLPQMYVSLGVLLGLYFLARGASILDSVVAYATSPLLRVRWLFLLWAGASMLWSPYHGPMALSHLITFLEIHLLGMVFYDATRSLGQLRWMLLTLVVTVVLSTAQTLWTGLSADVMRLSGVYGNPNVFAVTSLLAFAAILSGVNLGRGIWGKILSYAAILIIGGGVVASTSRKGVLGMPLMCVLTMVVPSTRRRGAIAAVLLVASLVIVNATGGALQRFWGFCVERTVAVGNWLSAVGSVDGSLVDRGRLLAKGAALIVQSPFIGHGLDSFYWISGEALYTHSNYLELSVALGLIGALLYYGLHAQLVRKSLGRAIRRLPSARFTFFLIFLMVFLDIAMVSYRMKLPTLLMIACAGWLEGVHEHE
jgi:O-antigen ligase